MTRKEALEELKKPLYDPTELKNDKEYVVKKLGFTMEEFDELMKQAPKSHYDFKTEGTIDSHYPILKPVKFVYKKFK